MADEGDDPPRKSNTDFERMSLDSLKREMAVQKAKTESAREESKARLAEGDKQAKAFPWAAVLGIVVLGLGGFFGLVYALRASFPEVAQSVLPVFMYSPPDTGPPPAPDAWIAPHDAGVDAHHVTHHAPHPSGTGTGTTGGHGDDLGLGDLGGSDPIGGVGSH
jgi:hypothetical protein